MGRPLLTAEHAKEIRMIRLLTGCSAQSLAETYGVHRQTISNVLHGISFPNAGGPIEEPGSFKASRVKNPQHGSYYFWYRGCRCDTCRDWNADRCAEWRRRTGNNGHRKV